ncbi:GNAT family N-acetyltransferase [Pseudomonas poae]|uniref:GNAT family N-acetyltransferase n=1 Tax=Pseudomonas poae TaxID=200451 RepID=A0A2S9DXH6_9PSED|nr:GNAT family N-acetyltransferase [Pseudomonas poae]PRA21324.1 GNAT family N-acetyltransferase [Pseudomonas poae]PRC07285.1 GNAT family N-acetyltransferase [Pseudomonas poae]
MTFHLRVATDRDRSFARTLTCQAMNCYYEHYGFIWSNDGFDTAWARRENCLICRDGEVIGFISLSRDDDALFIRELHLIEAFRGQGAGTWVLEQMVLKACALGLGLLRLTVFKTNPARNLYLRQGFNIVSEENCFWSMELICPRRD